MKHLVGFEPIVLVNLVNPGISPPFLFQPLPGRCLPVRPPRGAQTFLQSLAWEILCLSRLRDSSHYSRQILLRCPGRQGGERIEQDLGDVGQYDFEIVEGSSVGVFDKGGTAPPLRQDPASDRAVLALS